MAAHDIVQNLISRLGQSQGDRLPPELDRHFVNVDEHEPVDQLSFWTRLAAQLNYYKDDAASSSGSWSAFFQSLPQDRRQLEQMLDDQSGALPPHLALLFAFLRLYEGPRESINRFARRHLDFYFEDVLRFRPRGAIPDRAHVVVELKPGAAPIAIRPEHEFSAGKDATGLELVYAPDHETVVNRASVASLRSLFLDTRGRGVVLQAPVANSSDGLGGPIAGEEPRWSAFGHEGLPAAELGFAIASPVLRMREGARTVKLSLTLSGFAQSGLSSAVLAKAFQAYITGEKGWLGPYGVSAVAGQAGVVQLAFTVLASDRSVVDYRPEIHGYAYAAQAPVAQLVFTPTSAVGYSDVRMLTLVRAGVGVEVVGIVTTLALENDLGALDPKKAFLPFGPEPVVRSRFLVGCEEALAKKLTSLEITLGWRGITESFATRYAGYTQSVSSDSYFKASVSFQDGGGRQYLQSHDLFVPRSPIGERLFHFTPGGATVAAAADDGSTVHALKRAGSVWAIRSARQWTLRRPVLLSIAAPEPKPGFVTFALDQDFLHAAYRRETFTNALKYRTGEPVVLTEPYTPAAQNISVSYVAQSDDVEVSTPSLSAFTNPDVQFFHLSAFGQMREHAYQREQFAFVTRKDVPLVPTFEAAGEFFIGLEELRPGDGIGLLFQVAEGSADPELPRQAVTWFVLCDNYWKTLGTTEVVRDTTNQLLRSGIVQFVIPAEATSANTILPTGLIWLKASVPTHIDAVSLMIAVAANAVEVRFRDSGNDVHRLELPLEKGKISKLKVGLPTVKSMQQPYASFGGRPPESSDAVMVRAAERLRHKNRSISAWDYERLVLDAFPTVHTVKCVPHASRTGWQVPGHVLVVAVPDLRNRNGRDPLRPKVDADTLSAIKTLIDQRCGMQVTTHVQNPAYQTIQVDCAVKFRVGYEPTFYLRQLNQDLTRFLSPWAFANQPTLSFGGRVYRSVLLAFVEGREYVEYVTDFRMYSYAGAPNAHDLVDVRPERPDAILVSAPSHLLREAS